MKTLLLIPFLVAFGLFATGELRAGDSGEAADPPEFNEASIMFNTPRHHYDEAPCLIYGKWRHWRNYEPQDWVIEISPEKLVDPARGRSWEVRPDLTSVKLEDWPADKFSVYAASDSCINCSAFIAVFVEPATYDPVFECRLVTRFVEGVVGNYLDLNKDDGGVNLHPTE